MKQNQNFSSTRWRIWGIVAVTLGVLLLIWWQAGRWYRAELLARQRAEANVALAPYNRALTAAIDSRFNRLAGLKAFVETHYSREHVDKEFVTFASGLYSGATGIRNFVIAPAGINQYVYPLVRNEVVPRHNQFTDQRAEARADAFEAKKTGNLIITGPYELRQGGLGLVARQAVYQDDGSFWGMVSMVIDLPPIFSDAGLDQAGANLALALRTPEGITFFGSEQTFRSEPVIQQVELLDGYWELAGVPQQGWQSAINQDLVWFNGFGLVLVGLVTLLVYSIASRHMELGIAVQKRTAELAKTNTQLQQEINDRTRAQEQLRLQAKLLDSVRESVVATDLEGNIIYWGKGAEKLYGYSAVEALGQSVTFIVESGETAVEKARMQQVRQTGSWRGQYLQKRKDGSAFWAETIISLVRDETGQPQALVGVDRDISDRKQAEAALRESERRFRDVLENVRLAAIMLDKKGNLTFCNQFFLELTGWQQADILEANWFETFIPYEARTDLRRAVFDQTINTGQFPAYYENEIVTRAGERRLIYWNNTVYHDPQGQIAGVTSLGSDITEQKQAERRLKASLSEKIVLLREIHHRVKNNLQIISSLLALQATHVDDEYTRQALTESQNRVRSMGLIHEILYQSPDLTRVDMSRYLENAVRQLFSVYPGRSDDIRLHTEVDPISLDLDTAIPCGLIINELVSNVLKHAFPHRPAKGEDAEYRILVCLCAEDSRRIKLTVTDNGIGLPPEFSWQHTNTLGLQLVHILAKQIEGTISYPSSSPGTSVVITFPYQQV